MPLSFANLSASPLPPARKIAWLSLVMGTMILGSLALSCAAPLAALAAFAALTLNLRQGALFALTAWIVNQAVGFGFKGYPTDPTTLMWGAIMGGATLAAFAAAYAAARAFYGRPYPVIASALIAAFVGFQTVLLIANLAVYDYALGFTFAVKGKMLLINIAALAITGAMDKAAHITGLLSAPAPHAA